METPRCLEHRIDDALWKYDEENKENPLHYSLSGGSNSTASGDSLVFQAYNSPNAFVVIVYNDENDWRTQHYKIITTEERVRLLIEPLVQEYVREMEEYYNKGK